MRQIQTEKAPQIQVDKKIVAAKEKAIQALNALHWTLKDSGMDSRADARKVELMIPKIKSIRA